MQPQKEWCVLNSKVLYLIHLNGNSLLPRIDKLRNIAKLSNAAFIGTNESKLDYSILLFEIHISNYNTPCCDRGRLGGWIVCYVRKDLSYDVKSFFFCAWNWKHFLRTITTKYETNSCWNHLWTTYSIRIFRNYIYPF